MKTMSIEQIKVIAKSILGVDPYFETPDSVSFQFPNFQSIHSLTLERCGFPYYFISPYCNSNYESYLVLDVFTHKL